MLTGKGTPRTEIKRARKFALARDFALLVSEDLLPFSFVEGPGLKRFLLRRGIVSDASEIPVRTTISRGALDDAYETMKTLVTSKLPTDAKYHISTDTWTDRYRHLPYIAVVVHVLDEHFKLLTVPLKTDHLPAPHTGSAILEDVLNTVKDFGLNRERLFAVISDSASNMIRAFRDFAHIRCADHKIHRALTADFYKTETGKRVLSHRCALMKIYRHLIYKKQRIAQLGKEKSQEIYLDALGRAEDIERVSTLW